MPEPQQKSGSLRGTPDEIIPDPIAPLGYVDPITNPEGSRKITRGATVPAQTDLVPKMPYQAISNYGSLFGAKTAQPQAVPSGEQNTSANQQAIVDLMKQFTTPISDEVLRAGITPVPSGSAMPIPPSLTRPVDQYQDRPFNRERVVGAGNARARGIGNAITGVTNAVGHVVQAEKQKEQDKLSVSTQRLMQSQQAIDQANMFLKDPNIDPARKKALQDSVERNTKVMGTILDDPKTRKSLEKGLNISFTDPSKNTTDQHNAVQAGIKTYQQQLEEQMPQTMGQDPMAQVRMQEAIRQEQAGQKLMQSLIPRIMTASSAMERAQYMQHGREMLQLDNHRFQAEKLSQQFANSKELAGIKHQYRLGEISTQIQQMGQKAMELFQNEKLDPVALFDAQQKFYEVSARGEASINGAQGAAITAIAQLESALGKPNIDADTRKLLTAQIQQMQAFQKNLDQQMTNFQQWKNRYNGVITNLQNIGAGQAPANGGQSGTGTGSAGATSGVGAAGGAFDPSTLLYGVPFGAGGALPTADGSDESDESDESDNE